MSKFNTTDKANHRTISHEGGTVYDKQMEDEWINLLFSSFLEPGFYTNGSARIDRFKGLTSKMMVLHGYDFVAKAAVYSRNVLGIRSISTLTAAMLNDKKFDNKRGFYRSYFHRPDDVAEILALVDSMGGKRSHALIRGAGDYVSTLDEYQLDKYSMTDKKYNMYDIISLTHPKSVAADRYVNHQVGTAVTFDTALSTAKTEEEKAEAWIDLVKSEKLGYIALIRNLRNILEADSSEEFVNSCLIPQITNKTKIKGSLVYPYQIYQAYKMIKGTSTIDVDCALSKAFKIAIGNMPKLNGKSVVVLDISGSMDSTISEKSNMTIKEVGALYAACLKLSSKNDNDVILFGTYAKKLSGTYPKDPFKLIEHLITDYDELGYGTNMSPVFDLMNTRYDRIFLISDMQIMDKSRRVGWYWGDTDTKSGNEIYRDYCKEYGPCHMYSFDLGGYHNQVLKTGTDDITYITTLNDKVFQFIEMQESGRTLVDLINEYTY